MKLHLTLEKGGVIKIESLDVSQLLSLGDYAKTIRHYMDENWKLKNVKCKNKEVERFFRKLIDDYETDSDSFRAPVKDTVKMGLKLAKTKAVKEAWIETEKMEKKKKAERQTNAKDQKDC
ncbi:MAG: hypothetical protein OEY47_06675 [Candidatus Bathyarchaeota archaeon]|nr:hypothetical protein [Candidatus Bathyarchaeota archaeon]